MMGGYGRGYYGGNMMGGGWLYEIFFFCFGLLILAGIVLLIVWAVRTMSGGHGTGHAGPPLSGTSGPTKPSASQDEACAIARKRYANGEITKEQYEEICKTLGV
jgi:putative membrane protein